MDVLEEEDPASQEADAPATPYFPRSLTLPPLGFNQPARGSDFTFDRCESTPPPILPMGSVVRFYVTSAARSYVQPWVVQKEFQSTGTGFAIAGNLLMTNAHVVEDATVVEVKKQQEPKKYRARVLCIGHDVDLALVSVDDARFWENPKPLEPIKWGSKDQYPELYSEVRAVGFPTGGSTVCVTKGVISRVDAQLYVHPRLKGVYAGTENSPGNLPIIQIDAAINPGNSGGPAFNANAEVVGVASSGMPKAQNVGYIIPNKVARLFLEEYMSSKCWSGVCETGLRAEALESDTMRKYLKMGDRTGVRITSVAPMGAAADKVSPGDILFQIDGLRVSSEGTVALNISNQDVEVPFDVLITQKPKGANTYLGLLRDGEEVQLEIIFRPIPPLAPRFDRYDCSPEYVIVGGLVFSKQCIPLIHEYVTMPREQRRVIMTSETIDKGTSAWKLKAEQEVVVLLRILKHTVNIGYPGHLVRVLERFNGEPVNTLKDLSDAVSAALEKAERAVGTGDAILESGEASPCTFLCFGFFNAQPEGADSIVLEAAQVRKANEEICRSHRIAKAVQIGDE